MMIAVARSHDHRPATTVAIAAATI